MIDKRSLYFEVADESRTDHSATQAALRVCWSGQYDSHQKTYSGFVNPRRFVLAHNAI